MTEEFYLITFDSIYMKIPKSDLRIAIDLLEMLESKIKFEDDKSCKHESKSIN